MTIWIDAQLSPYLALWINNNFPFVKAHSLRSLNLLTSADKEIYFKAREANVILMSKDADFVRLLDTFGPPPKLIWITCGNTSNSEMTRVLQSSLNKALTLLNKGEMLVEIK